MLCDWLTLRYEVRTEQDLRLVEQLGKDRELCVRLKGGEMVSQWWPRESSSTDTHRITIGLSLGSITIEGSPARIGNTSNVFGSGDPSACAAGMLQAAIKASGVILPPLTRWKATRIDLTQNYDCGNHVAEALEALRHASGGHLRVRSIGQSAFWNTGSDYWSAIAYPKGPHLQKQVRKGLVHETEENISLAHRLVRFELRLRNQYLRRSGIEIASFNESQAMTHFLNLASKIIPTNAEITTEQQFTERITALFGKRRARTLLGTWALIQQIGEFGARERMSQATWYRDQKDLFKAGLTRADFGSGKVVAFRPKAIVSRPVDSWEDLKRVA